MHLNAELILILMCLNQTMIKLVPKLILLLLVENIQSKFLIKWSQSAWIRSYEVSIHQEMGPVRLSYPELEKSVLSMELSSS